MLPNTDYQAKLLRGYNFYETFRAFYGFWLIWEGSRDWDGISRNTAPFVAQGVRGPSTAQTGCLPSQMGKNLLFSHTHDVFTWWRTLIAFSK